MYSHLWHQLIVNESTWFDGSYPCHLVDEDICHHYWGISWQDHNARVSLKGLEMTCSGEQHLLYRTWASSYLWKPTHCDWLAHYLQLDSECFYPHCLCVERTLKETWIVQSCLQASYWLLTPFPNSHLWLLEHSVPCFLFRSAMSQVGWPGIFPYRHLPGHLKIYKQGPIAEFSINFDAFCGSSFD